MIVRYRAQALTDIDGIYRYIRERSPSGALRVIRAIYAGIHLIAERPLAAPNSDKPGIRVKIVTQYRYKIFYSVETDAIEIIHVRHMSRQPWR